MASDQHQAHRRRVHALASKTKGNTNQALQGIVSWLNSLGSSVNHLLGVPLGNFAKDTADVVDLIRRGQLATRQTLHRLAAWVKSELIEALARYINRRLARVEAMVRIDFMRLLRALDQGLLAVTKLAQLLTAHERRERQRAIARAEAEDRRRVRQLHQQIEREAVSGYKAGQPARLGIIGQIADLIATQNPATRALVGDLVKGVLDLAVIDDPLARLTLTFVLRHIIDRLGIDRVIGDLLQRLLAAILGESPPNGLASVISDLCARLAAVEGQWADFFAHGGSDVEQAGDEWQQLHSPIIDLALLGTVGLAVADPSAWAADVSAVFGPIVDSTLLAAADLIRKA